MPLIKGAKYYYDSLSLKINEAAIEEPIKPSTTYKDTSVGIW